MSAGFVGVVVSDPCLQGHFTQVELRSLKAKVVANPNTYILLIPHRLFF